MLEDATLGASIAVNGCCLTVVELGDGYWAADAVVETLDRTSLGDLAPGDPVNLERPVRLADRLGGHVVQGHVDATGTVRSREVQPDGSERFRFDAPAEVLRYVVHKGSITVDGISLTVAALYDEPNERGFEIAAIPHTLAVTTLGARRPGGARESRSRSHRQVRGTPPRSRSEPDMMFEAVERALDAVRRGEFVVVVDDEDRENEGDLIIAAEKMTPDKMAFMIRYTSGVICLPLEGDRLDELQLPLMVSGNENTEGQRTAFTVSVDARHGTTTGISAADRSATVLALIDRNTAAADLARPGHIFPLRYREGGVLKRAGHTEAAVDLARLAGGYPAGVLAEIVNDDGTMQRRPDLEAFAAEHGLVLVTIADLIRFRRHREKLVRRVSEARIPTQYGDFTAHVFESLLDNTEHLAFVRGEVAGKENVLVRVHSECLTGDVFGSLRCDCGVQLDRALEKVAEPRARAWSCISAVTKGGASVSATSCARTRCRTRAATPSRRISSSASRSTRASTASARRSSSISASPPCA